MEQELFNFPAVLSRNVQRPQQTCLEVFGLTLPLEFLPTSTLLEVGTHYHPTQSLLEAMVI